MQGHASRDTTGFIQSFTGSHRFVPGHLVEEVLQKQPESVQTFLLRTSILDRLCGPLCDAVLGINEHPHLRRSAAQVQVSANQRITPAVVRPFAESPFADSQSLLEHLERANLFIVPLDNERRWYRYRQPQELPDYRLRASTWYETNNDLAEAFQPCSCGRRF